MPICHDCVKHLKLNLDKDRILTQSLSTCSFCERENLACSPDRDYGFPTLPKTESNPELNVMGWYPGEAVFKYVAAAHDGHSEPRLKLEVLDAGEGNYIQISGKGIAFDSHKEIDTFASFLKSFLPTPIKHPPKPF